MLVLQSIDRILLYSIYVQRLYKRHSRLSWKQRRRPPSSSQSFQTETQTFNKNKKNEGTRMTSTNTPQSWRKLHRKACIYISGIRFHGNDNIVYSTSQGALFNQVHGSRDPENQWIQMSPSRSETQPNIWTFSSDFKRLRERRMLCEYIETASEH